jgi:hypothetical protein
MPLDTVLDGPRPTDPARVTRWLDLRWKVVATLLVGGPFDPRRRPEDPAACAQWLHQRRAFLAEALRDDARFIVWKCP